MLWLLCFGCMPVVFSLPQTMQRRGSAAVSGTALVPTGAPAAQLRAPSAQRRAACRAQLLCAEAPGSTQSPVPWPGQAHGLGSRGGRRSLRRRAAQADVVGLGQAMIDFAAYVDEGFLQRFAVDKGGRRLISAQERSTVLQSLESSYQVNAAGSLTNTLLALARISQAAAVTGRGQPLQLAAACLGGDDALGYFYRRAVESAGIELLTEPEPESHTGVVMVLTTPDANRTFLTHLGSAAQTQVSERLAAAIAGCRLLLVEGYLWEMPQAQAFIGHAAQLARDHGAMIALTAGDAGVMARHRTEVMDLLDEGVDVLFMNQDEAHALLGDSSVDAAEAAKRLAEECGMVAITDGSRGSCICTLGRLLVVPPYWTKDKPVDSCGAGDAYAAGVLHGLLSGLDPAAVGSCGSCCASAVIAKMGANLTQEEATVLCQDFPTATSTPWNLRSLLAQPSQHAVAPGS